MNDVPKSRNNKCSDDDWFLLCSIGVMRKLIGILLLLQASGSFSQAPIVKLHHTESMRYYLQNSAIHAYLYSQVARHLELSYDFDYVKSQFYHNNYLFHEPFSWAKPVTRKLEMVAQGLKPGEPGWEGVVPFDTLLMEMIGRREFQAFKWEDFVYRYSYEDQDSLIRVEKIDAKHLLVKELWARHMKTGDLERHISAVAILNVEGKVLMWLPFEEIRYSLRNANTFIDGDYFHYEDYLLNGLYPSSKILKSGPTKCVEFFSDDNFGAELDALYEIEELKMQSAWARYKGLKKGSFKSKQMEFSERNQLFEGSASWRGSDGFRYEGNFVSGKLEGWLKATDDDKNLRLQAQFKAGKLEGKTSTFFENGLVQHDYRFVANTPDSVQNVYYSDGQLRFTYNFKEGEMNGAYERYTDKGKLAVKGKFENGLIRGDWEIHHEFARMFCLHFKETDFQWTSNVNLDPSAFDDCTFDAYFKLEVVHNKGCPNGSCVIPRLDGMIR